MTLRSCFLAAAALCAAPASAGGVRVLGIQIDGLHSVDHSGDYDKVVAKAKDAQLDTKPASAAFDDFAKCTMCCISPANKNPEFYDFTGDSYLASKPMNIARIYIYSAAGKPPVSSLAALKGKKVGLRRGLPYGRTIEGSKAFTKELGDTPEVNIQKLQAGQVDYLLEYTPDMDLAFARLKMAKLPYTPDEPIETHRDSVVCKSSPETKALVEQLNSAIGK